MRLKPIILAATLLLAGAPVAFAQSAAQPTGTSGRLEDRAVDVSRLPIDVQRVERRFRATTIREERDGLNLRYFVDVYGRAPDIVLFTREDNLEYGPVPYGAPSHREMVDMVTPREYRAPAADFSNLFRWLAKKSKDKSK